MRRSVHAMTQIEQAECPEWARRVDPEWKRNPDYSNHPPGKGLRNGGCFVMDMAEGDDAFIVPGGVHVDDRGKLWVSGRTFAQTYQDDDRRVRISRTKDGIEVLDWELGRTIRNNGYPHYSEDVWVVLFPDGPVRCHICARAGQPDDFDRFSGKDDLPPDDYYECREQDRDACTPWIESTDLGRSWMRGRS